MEGAILSSQSNSRFRTHLKNAASALCARTLPKQQRTDAAVTTSRHHTYPRVSPQKRAKIPCRLEPLMAATERIKAEEVDRSTQIQQYSECYSVPISLDVAEIRGAMAREVASAWVSRVGSLKTAAPADRVQCLFNDIELYPTKTQVFEMLVCARQCARRKSLTLTFGEFCVFAAELRHYTQQARQSSSKPESPQQNILKRYQEKAAKYFNGSEASSPPHEIFLGGSCNPTTWRSDIAIPMLKELGITYFNPQVEYWSTELMEVEDRAKAAAQALLFVLDRETRAVAASVEAAHHATSPRDLLLVLRPYARHQTIGQETISDQEYTELSRARATLQELVERRGLPVFSDIRAALGCAYAVLRRARTYPRRQLGQTILRLKRAFDAAGGKASSLPRSKAIDALRDLTKAPRELAERCLLPGVEEVDFEIFCATVAEMSTEAGLAEADTCVGATVGERVRRALRNLRERFANTQADFHLRNGQEVNETASAEAAANPEVAACAETSPYDACNARLRSYRRKLRLFIPKNGGSRECTSPAACGAASRGSGGGDSLLTPGTERRLQELPAMLGMPARDVYLGGCFPTTGPRPEEKLKSEGYSYAMPRPNDYTRMFSVPTRRSAPAPPESPHTDKKPRGALDDTLGSLDDTLDVQLRKREDYAQPEDRLSASEFYKVSEDVTPQPFKGTYDEDLILGSRVLLFSMNSESPCFAPMVLAAHYMGLRPSATILLVQPMDPASAHPYSQAAVSDYNRGRTYLADLAQRSGVPVFNNTEAALACVISRLRVTP